MGSTWFASSGRWLDQIRQVAHDLVQRQDLQRLAPLRPVHGLTLLVGKPSSAMDEQAVIDLPGKGRAAAREAIKPRQVIARVFKV